MLAKDSVEQLLKSCDKYLLPQGTLVIQTLHPIFYDKNSEYKSGWREGSWQGFSQKFCDPAPWYFRTLEDWVELIVKSGLVLEQVLEPIHPKTSAPASIIYVAKSKQ